MTHKMVIINFPYQAADIVNIYVENGQKWQFLQSLEFAPFLIGIFFRLGIANFLLFQFQHIKGASIHCRYQFKPLFI